MPDENYGMNVRVQVQKIRDDEFNRVMAIRRENEYDLDIGMSGTSGTIVIIKDNNHVFYGNVGDSLACLSIFQPPGTVDSLYKNNKMILTQPFHLPEDTTEKMRIYRHKGEVRGTKYESSARKNNTKD